MAKKKDKIADDESPLAKFKRENKDILVSLDSLRRKPSELLSTGSLKVDGLLKGGLVRGTISEFYGPNRSGKSTLALSTAAQAIKQGGTAAYFDLERGLDGGIDLGEKQLKGWLQTNGIDNDENFVIIKPIFGEDIYEQLEDMILSNVFDLVVIDSMAGIISRNQMEGDIGAGNFGKTAKLNSESLPRLMIRFGQVKDPRTHINIINQVRENLANPHGGVKGTGGKALTHYTACRLKLTRIGGSTHEQKETYTDTRVESEKSRYSKAGRVEIQINAQYGVDVLNELLEFAEMRDTVIKEGAWYTFIDPATGEELYKVQGAIKAKNYIRSSGLEATLFEQAKATIFGEDE